MQKQLNSISRFLQHTTEPFDNWYWNGEELIIIFNNKVIETYLYQDLKEIIIDFE